MSQYVVLLTGASRGIGKSTAISLAQQSKVTHIILVSRKSEDLKVVEREIKSKNENIIVKTVEADLNDPTAPSKIIKEVESIGQLNLLINNAAYGAAERIADIKASGEDFANSNLHRVFQINALSLIQLSSLAIPYLRQTKGTMVSISSGAAKSKITGLAVYSITKTVVNEFTEYLALEEKDITVVALNPGLVDTDMAASSRESDGIIDDKFLSWMKQQKESGQINKPEVVGRRIAEFSVLASKDWSGKYADVNTDEQILALIKE